MVECKHQVWKHEMRSHQSACVQFGQSKRFIERALLNERQKRIFFGYLSDAMGYGGNAAIIKNFGISSHTVLKGLQEFRGEEQLQKGRIRKEGGGRKRLEEKQVGLTEFIEKTVEGSSYGTPDKVLFWTTLSLREIAQLAQNSGFQVSHTAVGQILEQLGYSKQCNQKMLQVGLAHANRDEQFRFIEAEVKTFLEQGDPIISVDCKKKENIGNFKNNGKEYRHQKDARKVLDHDFPIRELGKIAPYGVYVVNDNTAFVNLGTNHDTGQFAAQSCMDWWDLIGKQNFPNSRKILITCDGGGSNGSRNKLWKFSLACLAQLAHLEIHVCHFPPGTSKWNKIEHRLFCYISKNWEGKPLIDIQTAVNLIATTTTNKGLKVQCKVDERYYQTGIKVQEAQFEQIDIERKPKLGEWNYIIRGFKKAS